MRYNFPSRRSACSTTSRVFNSAPAFECPSFPQDGYPEFTEFQDDFCYPRTHSQEGRKVHFDEEQPTVEDIVMFCGCPLPPWVCAASPLPHYNLSNLPALSVAPIESISNRSGYITSLVMNHTEDWFSLRPWIKINQLQEIILWNVHPSLVMSLLHAAPYLEAFQIQCCPSMNASEAPSEYSEVGWSELKPNSLSLGYVTSDLYSALIKFGQRVEELSMWFVTLRNDQSLGIRNSQVKRLTMWESVFDLVEPRELPKQLCQLELNIHYLGEGRSAEIEWVKHLQTLKRSLKALSSIYILVQIDEGSFMKLSERERLAMEDDLHQIGRHCHLGYWSWWGVLEQ